jgi:hypothetical protein
MNRKPGPFRDIFRPLVVCAKGVADDEGEEEGLCGRDRRHRAVVGAPQNGGHQASREQQRTSRLNETLLR